MFIFFILNYLYSSCLQNPQFSPYNDYRGIPIDKYPRFGVPSLPNQMSFDGQNRISPPAFQTFPNMDPVQNRISPSAFQTFPNVDPVQNEMFPNFGNTFGLTGENRMSPPIQNVENRRKGS